MSDNKKYNYNNKNDEYLFNCRLFDERVNRSFRRGLCSTLDKIAFDSNVVDALSENPRYSMYSIHIAHSRIQYVFDYLWNKTRIFSSRQSELFGEFEEL